MNETQGCLFFGVHEVTILAEIMGHPLFYQPRFINAGLTLD